MKISPTYARPLTEEEETARRQAEAELIAKRQAAQAAAELQAAEETKANGATVSLCEKSLSALTSHDQRIPFNIQWGIVKGFALYSLLMLRVLIVYAIVESVTK
ncbi:MAG: hypothetical protein WAM85_23270 [Terracidiphilus sp.]